MVDSYSGQRICQVIQLKAEYIEEYKRIHKDVWPAVLETLRRSHIVDYSIYLLPSPPYASSHIPSNLTAPQGASETALRRASDCDRVAEDEVTRQWWKITDRMQVSLIEGAKGSGDGEWWLNCEEVFRFEQ
ncbi:hypothetical protein BS47DRAFT_1347358 [Hydnum rufescens UP504]|uniref:L-rhamnose mutarotase n=1 Tax=Hydnum rufescens UP504 TaxID=1448309 RepID=A0A9P6AS52_9AGAM|nr:hypothetical protein BS47DRAFT_1347358 [Hydnum rufescens UP504]